MATIPDGGCGECASDGGSCLLAGGAGEQLALAQVRLKYSHTQYVGLTEALRDCPSIIVIV